jgi:hypothetical protein
MSSICCPVQRRPSFLHRQGCVASEWCSHAALLSVPWIKHTDRRRGEEPRDKVYSAQDNNTNICVYIICLSWRQLMHAMQTDGSIRPYVHTHTQNKTQTYTHLHTHTHTYAQGKKSNKHTRITCLRDTKHTYNDIIPKVWFRPTSALKASCTGHLRTHTLVA